MCQAADALRQAEAARAASGAASVSSPRKAATAHYGRRAPRHVADRDRLVLLGTGGGSAPKSTRAGFANAVVVGADAYLIDCGARVIDQALQAGISVNRRRTPRGGATIRSICLTHLHSDHVIDLVNILLSFWPDETIRLLGPGPAGLPIPTFPPGRVAPVINPDEPTPGTAALLDHLFAAFAYNINLRMADEGRLNPVERVEVSEIGVGRDGFEPDVELGVVASGGSPDTTAPAMEPVVVHPEDDNGVTISTILVQHAPVFPALAYRVDTPSGSVVFSGDPGPCDNVVRLARGADILVHEAMDIEGVGRRVAHLPNRDELIAHMAKAHTAPEEAGRIASEAGVGALVLSHLVPGDDEVPESVWEERARENFDGPVLCAVDLDEFALTDALR
jgi:ribonuclease BN (tRNA processing enzyme)